MVYIYAASIKDIPDPSEDKSIMDGLWEERKERILRHQKKNDRKRSLTAGLLLKYVFEQYHISMNQLRYGEHGKPEASSLYFNLSHSEDYVICAVSQKAAVGSDIEVISEFNEKTAQRVCTTREWAYLQQLEEGKRAEEFFRIWTMKESYMKMTGEGILRPISRFEVSFGEPIEIYRDGVKCHCHVKEYNIPNYKVAICSEDLEFVENIKYVINL